MKVKDLIEMALITDDHLGYSLALDFSNDFKKLKLISNDIGLLGNKIYSGHDVFYLTNKDDKYLGHIEYHMFDKDKMMVDSTYTVEPKTGLYELMFKCILAKTNFKYIFGGDQQSEKAIGSWKKQLMKFKKKVYNTETNNIEEFDDSKEDEYWTKNKDMSKKYLVGISESDNHIKRDFVDAEQRLNITESRGRIMRPNNEILVRFFGFDNDTAEELIKICEFQEYNDATKSLLD